MAATVTGFKGIVDQAGEARRFHRTAVPVVGSATDLKVSSSGTRVMTIAAGTCMAAGIHFKETASQTVTLPANTSGQPRFDIVGLRFTWTADGGTVVPFSKQGTPSATPTSPKPDRIPGNVYELVLALVYVRASVSTISSSDLYDMRVWGGVGGPFRAGQATWFTRMDLPLGAEVLVGTSLYEITSRDLANNLVSATVKDAQITAWKAWVPNLRNNNNTLITATSFFKDGRYRIQDGQCRLKIRLGLYGTVNDWTNFDGVPYRIDLPVKVGTQLTDQWLDATILYPGWPWVHGKILLRSGATQGLVYVVASEVDNRVRVMNTRPEVVVVDGSYLI